MSSAKSLLTIVLGLGLAACTAEDSIELGQLSQHIEEVGKDPILGTDRVDYQPGETVTITGAGFLAGEPVTITLLEEPHLHDHVILAATADENGAFVNTDFAPDENDIGTLFTAVAIGNLSGRSGTVGFSDGGAAGGGEITSYTITTGTGSLGPLGTSLGISCDDCTRTINLPWNTRIYDQVFKTVSVSSNGVLGFVSNNAAFSNQPLSSVSYFSYALVPFWDDLWTIHGGGAPSDTSVYTSITGTVPHRQFHIRWHVTYIYAVGSRADFEVVLYEDDQAFDFIYGGLAFTNSATVGVMKDQAHVTQYSHNGSPVSVHQGLRLRFTPVQADDNTAPIANAGPDQTLTCLRSGVEVPVALDGSASSDPDGDPLSFSWLNGQTQLATGMQPTVQLAPGEHNVTLDVSDGELSATDSVLLTLVADTLAPLMSVNPGPPGLECGDVYADHGATATDDCDGTLQATALGSIPSSPPGTYEIRYEAIDSNNNRASAARTVIVDDTLAPVISVNPGPPGLECATPYHDPSATAADHCVGALPVNVNGSINPMQVGAQQLIYSATDGEFVTTATRDVFVQDTIQPTLALNGAAAFTLECGLEAYQELGASAHDACAGDLSVQISPPPSNLELGTHAVHYSAWDGYTQPVGATRFVTVQDTTAPQLAAMTDQVLEATGPNGAAAFFIPSAASDACDPQPQVACDHASGTTFPLGTNIVTCTAVDASGNQGHTQFAITVVDTTPPELTQPSDISVIASSVLGNVVNYDAPTATDIVDQNPSVHCSPASGSQFAPGTTTVSCTATDFSGNSVTKTFAVHVTYAWSGFLSPINTDGTSIFKLGSTIPVKFRLTDASAGITNLTARIYIAKVANNVTGSEVEALSTASATTGNLFRYDATAGQYIFNLSTKGLSTGTWQIRADFGDGVLRTVLVSLK